MSQVLRAADQGRMQCELSAWRQSGFACTAYWMATECRVDTDTAMVDADWRQIGASVPWLRHKLADLGVTLAPNSALALGLADSKTHGDGAANDDRLTMDVERFRWFLRASGTDFLSKALHAGETCALGGFDQHFRALRSGDPLLTAPSTTRQSQQRDHTWELLLASACAVISANVTPDEPDVVCRFEGEDIGLAAKIFYSDDIDRHLDAIKKGAQQLEDSRATHGFVAINLVELVPHEQLFSEWLGKDIGGHEAVEMMSTWCDCFMSAYNLKSWAARLRKTTKLSAILFFVPTVVPIMVPEPALVPYYRIHVTHLEGREDRAQPFVQALNWVFQCVLSFRGDPAIFSAPDL